jgi:hypothetical protein
MIWLAFVDQKMDTFNLNAPKAFGSVGLWYTFFCILIQFLFLSFLRVVCLTGMDSYFLYYCPMLVLFYLCIFRLAKFTTLDNMSVYTFYLVLLTETRSKVAYQFRVDIFLCFCQLHIEITRSKNTFSPSMHAKTCVLSYLIQGTEERSCICVLGGIEFVTVSTAFIIDFGTVPTVWYFLVFFILLGY